MSVGNIPANDPTETLRDHVVELRNRVIIVALTLIVGASLAYVFREQILVFLTIPLNGRELISLTPGGGFAFIFNISLAAGAAFAFPVLIYHVYAFIRPLMPVKVQRKSVGIIISSILLLLAGAAFAYVFAIPGALKFLFEFPEGFVNSSELAADSYLKFIIQYMLGMGLIFQVPLILLFIHWITPLKPKQLLRTERWVVLVAFIIAAIITPTPDPLNQTVVALPIIAVYQIGVVIIMVLHYREARHVKKANSHAERVSRKKVDTPVSVHKPIPLHATQPVSSIKPTAPKKIFIDAIVPANSSSQPKRVIHRSQINVPHRVDVARVAAKARTPVQGPQSQRRPLRYLDGVSPIFSD